jgi:hypothetical protein
MAPYPTRVRIKSSASLNVPPGNVVDVVGFLLVFMFKCVTVSPGAVAAMARSSAILADPTIHRNTEPPLLLLFKK